MPFDRALWHSDPIVGAKTGPNRVSLRAPRAPSSVLLHPDRLSLVTGPSPVLLAQVLMILLKTFD